MNFKSRVLLLQFLLLLTAAILTSATSCRKLIEGDGPTGNVGASRDIMETGRYTIRTSLKTDSPSVQALVHELDGARDIDYHLMWFSAVLEPRDLKKVAICNAT